MSKRLIKILSRAEAPIIRVRGEIGREYYDAADFLNLYNLVKDSETVTVEFDSWGGDPWVAKEIADFMNLVDTQFVGKIVGSCASAATIIYAACDVREVTDKAWFMAHRAESIPEEWMNADQAQTYADAAKAIEDYMMNAYATAFGGTVEEWKNKLEEVISLEGSEIVTAGYADRIADDADYVPARFAASLYPDAPERLTLPVNQNQKTTIMPDTLYKIKSFFGWQGEDETDIAIQAKASADQLAGLKEKDSQIVTLNNKINKLKGDLKERDETIATFKASAETEQDEAINTIVEDAVKNYKIKASAKDAWIARFKADFDGTKSILDELDEGIHKPKAPGAPKGTKTKAYGVHPKVAEAFGK